jgi:hypothetical protein
MKSRLSPSICAFHLKHQPEEYPTNNHNHDKQKTSIPENQDEGLTLDILSSGWNTTVLTGDRAANDCGELLPFGSVCPMRLAK